MPNIVINEVDLTTTKDTSILTDIVFVPGFSDTNCNVYVYDTVDGEPTSETPGFAYVDGSTFSKQLYYDGDKVYARPRYDFNDSTYTYDKVQVSTPSFAINIVSRRVWVYTDESDVLGKFILGQGTLGAQEGEPSWKEILGVKLPSGIPDPDNTAYDTYAKQLKPENKPTLCRTLSEFLGYFGNDPIRFALDQSVSNGTEGSVKFKQGEFEPSFVAAVDYLSRGLSVLYYNVADRDENGQKKPYNATHKEIDAMYTSLGDNDLIEYLEDKNAVSFKYISTGGYPTYDIGDAYEGINAKLYAVARTRGDCVFIIDHIKYNDKTYEELRDSVTGFGEYATMFTPWAVYSTAYGNKSMPASYGYLTALATSVQGNPSYYAVAGVTRGALTNLRYLDTKYPLTNKIANDVLQPRDGVAINPITDITPYGWTIWGNRTLYTNKKNLVARTFLNIRNMISDIKKQAYVTAKRLMFEQDSDVLWTNFKMGISPLLDSMVANNGLSAYRIIRANNKWNGDPLNKGEIAAVIKIYPRYAVEDWDITVVISDDEVTVD